MKHKKPFTILPNAVLKDKRLTHADKIVYWAISTFAYGDKDTAYPGNDALFELTGIRSQHISGHTTRLRDCGYIEIRFEKRAARDVAKILYKLLPISPDTSQSSELPATTSVTNETGSGNSSGDRPVTTSVTEQPSNPEQSSVTVSVSTSNSQVSQGSQQSVGNIVQSEIVEAEPIHGSKGIKSNTGNTKGAYHGGYQIRSSTADALFASAVSDTTSGSYRDQQGLVDSFFERAKNESDESATRRSLDSFEEGHSGGISSGAGTAQGSGHQELNKQASSPPTVTPPPSQHLITNARDESRTYSKPEFMSMLTSGQQVIPFGDAEELISMPWFMLMGFKLYAPESDISNVDKVFSQMIHVGEVLIRWIFGQKDRWTLKGFVDEYGQLLKASFNGSLKVWSAGTTPTTASFANHIEHIISAYTYDWREKTCRSVHRTTPRGVIPY